MTSWPFTAAEITAGLRRYFAEPSLQVKSFGEYPLAVPDSLNPTAKSLRGLRVTYTVGPTKVSVDCVVKEPLGATRAGLAGFGRREVGFYRSLAPQLSVVTPALIAAHPAGEWMVLEAVESEISPTAWRAEDYARAVRTLAMLHERFWGLADDLAVYPWLARPLTGDFEIYLYAAAQAVEKLIAESSHPELTDNLAVRGVLSNIVAQLERIAQPLRAVPFTLLHGDLAPSSVALQADGEMVVGNWQMAALGPGVLDLVAFITSSQWEREQLPMSGAEMAALYRQEIEWRLGVRWTDAEWAELWDYAMLWRFAQEMLNWLVAVTPAVYAARRAQFETVWLQPVLAAAERRLTPVFYV